MAKSGIKHIDVGPELTKAEWESEESHTLVHGNAFPGSPVERQLFYRDDEHVWYIYDNTAWKSLQAAAVDKLDDIGDVSVAAPADDDLFYYDDATGLWKSRKLVDADIPAAIARDAEVDTKITNHKGDADAHHTKFTTTEHDVVARHPLANLDPLVCSEAEADAKVAAHGALTTGVHGVGALHVAGFHTAGQAVSKIIWKAALDQAMEDNDRTVTSAWIELDLTAHSSANAKGVWLLLYIRPDVVGAGAQVQLRVRKHGDDPTWFPTIRVNKNVGLVGTWEQLNAFVGCDNEQKIDYAIILAAGWTIDTALFVTGYVE